MAAMPIEMPSDGVVAVPPRARAGAGGSLWHFHDGPNAGGKDGPQQEGLLATGPEQGEPSGDLVNVWWTSGEHLVNIWLMVN